MFFFLASQVTGPRQSQVSFLVCRAGSLGFLVISRICTVAVSQCVPLRYLTRKAGGGGWVEGRTYRWRHDITGPKPQPD
jgi:hypothetical protein